jgi:hypothetical protein
VVSVSGAWGFWREDVPSACCASCEARNRRSAGAERCHLRRGARVWCAAVLQNWGACFRGLS